MNMQVLARSAEKADWFVGFAITLLRTLIFNLTALVYLVGFKRNWFERCEQQFRQGGMDVEGHLNYLLENKLDYAHCSKQSIKWFDDLFVVARVQKQDELALRISQTLLDEPVIWFVFRSYSRQFLRASLFYEIGVVCEALGSNREARLNYQVVIDVAEGLSRFPPRKRFAGWVRGLLAPNNETIVGTFSKLAAKRLDALSVAQCRQEAA